MSTPDNVKEDFIEIFKQLPIEDQQIILYIMENRGELMPITSKLDKNDKDYHDKLTFIVVAHRGGVMVDVIDGVPVI